MRLRSCLPRRQQPTWHGDAVISHRAPFSAAWLASPTHTQQAQPSERRKSIPKHALRREGA
eukprot:7513127-Alexandrium_andersonii.AAC.1